MNKAKRFLNTTLVYFVGTVLSKLVSFILLPIYTDRIPPNEFGSYDLVLTILNFLTPIAFFQIWDGMFRRSFDFEKEEHKYDVITNAHVVSFFGCIIYLMVFGAINSYFKFDYFIWAAIYGFSLSLQYLYSYVARVFLYNKLNVTTGVINTTITALLNIVLITVFDLGVASLYIAPAVGSFVQVIILEYNLKTFRHIRKKAIDSNEIVSMLRFSIPLCITSLSYWLLNGYSKIIIATMLGTYENGLYAVANKFGTIITLIVSIVQSAWNEMAYLMAGENDKNENYRICMDIMIKSVIIGTAILVIIIKWSYSFIIDSQYEEGFQIVPATVLGVMFNSVASFMSTLFMAEKNTKTIMKSTLLAASVNVVLCLALTHVFGLHGATISLAMSFLLLMMIRMYQCKKNYGISINTSVLIVGLICLTVAIIDFYTKENILIDIALVIILVSGFLWSIKDYLRGLIIQLKK